MSFSDRRRGDVRPGRRVGQRQDDDRALHAAADRADVGRGAVPRRGRARVSRATRMRAARAATCRSCFRIRIRRSTRACACGRSSRSRWSSTGSATRRARARVDRAVRLVGLDPAHARPVSARVQRRPAPAHRPRARARAEPVVPHRGRAGVGARRVGPGAGRQPADGSAAAARSSPTCSSRTICGWSSTSAAASR